MSRKLTIILLALVFINSSKSRRETKKRTTRAPAVEDISDESSLTHIRCEDSNFLGRITEETHVLEHGDRVLRLSEVLDEMRCGFLFALTFVVLDVDELEFMTKSTRGQ